MPINSHAVNTFLERYETPKLIQEETDNLNKPVISKEIELFIKITTHRKFRST